MSPYTPEKRVSISRYDLSVPEYYVTHRECGDCCDFHVVKGA